MDEERFNEDILSLEGEGITVTASPETTQQMETVTREEIARRHAPDLAVLLQEILDLGVTRYGAYGNDASINLRGFDSERIAFLVDGVPVNSPQGGEFDINQIDSASIERIEVIYGGSDTKYNVSGALGGVINIITVKKQEPGLRIGGSVSNTSVLPGYYREWDGTRGEPHWEDLADAQNVSFFTAYGAEKYSLSANLFANRAQNHFLYRDDIFMRTRRKDNNEVWDGGLRLSFVRDLDDYTKLILSGDAYYGDKNIPTSGFSSLAGKQKDFSTAQNIMLDMSRAFHDALAMEASITHNWHDRDFAPPSGAASRHDEHLVTAINRWSWYPAEKLTLRAGGDYRLSYLDSTDMGSRSRHDGGLYLTTEYQPHNSFLVIPSVKGVFSGPGAASPVVPVPKLGLLWQPTDYLTFKNNYYRSFKYPDFEDLYWSGDTTTQGNPDLKPEDGWGGDIGASWRYREYLTIGSTFFAQWTADSIHWSNKLGIWRPENVGEAAFFGSENKIKIKVPLSNIPLNEIGVSLSYQFLIGYLLSYGYTWESEKRIPYMPMHTFGASLDIPWIIGRQKLAGSIIISGHYETMRYADTANITKLDPYFLLNIDVNQDLSKNLAAFLAVNNALNTSYESFRDYPMPGLSLTLGMRFNL
ncbi:MAG: TonB-dependent receptor [Treponema sp.]|nr:TonB-dependent receptor [Treponema sp.]